MLQILVIEDDKDIQEVLKNYLTAEGYSVSLAGDGVEGIAAFHIGNPDLVLLDIMMPKIDGFAVCELLRRESDVPIIMVTARDSMEDQVRGLKLLADDYISKPFDMPVLMCRIAAVLRRAGKGQAAGRLRHGILEMDLEGYHVYEEGREIEVTQKEFELLRTFLANKGRVFTRQQLLDEVWGMDYFGDERIVDTHIKNLRKKMDSDYIQTVRGVGYRVEKKCQK
ncbi:response regulator transcription factor [Murimonas intestini]|uniref:Stage 0 sporulation protein A homolog n=1 Tax=Murimonas intestini TaxID=1337051 RepID=A0AB73T8D5_9FIRM|nr:response regulator transcription factor [Murimonas intestini]MCR1839937.1 response regulator transcription factor [Murimonas intestini]MCR1866777.1 response regulator transcription factor [Murimonas intestini]MCR1883610.1 response regulator transcription factor [Murimonas intestini]